jgi:hypothetical protein
MALLHREVMASWSGYTRSCWGFDEVIGGARCVNWLGVGATIVDSLSTLWILGERSEFYRGVDWVDGAHGGWRVENVFEVTIRVLGGLLSAYALSGDARLLRAAETVGVRILTNWRPYSFPSNTPGHQWHRFSLAEVGSLQLEFRYLWHATNRSDIRTLVASRACWVFERLTTNAVESSGLLTAYVNSRGQSVGSTFHIGGGADSFYEYMLKTHLQDGGRYPCAYARFRASRDAICSRLLRDWDDHTSYLVRVNRHGRVVSHNMDHLDCFSPGMLALDYRVSGNATVLESAKKLMAGCWQLYNLSSTVGVESVRFKPRDRPTIHNPANNLRPEVAESLYYLWKATADAKYREWGRRMFERFRTYSKFNGSYYCTMRDTRRPSCDGKMESFWIAETLKYLYLLETDAVDLDRWVFNTEAHPLPVVPSLPPCACAK